ncbi:unnamed protein product, partial [Durusdinium trenchii]
VLFSSSFFHGTNSHLLREVFLLILAGAPAEEELGTFVFLVVFLLSGACGCWLSWLTLRHQLRHSADFASMPVEHVDAVANLSNSRGSSACVYGAAVLGILVAGHQSLAASFRLSSPQAKAMLVGARLAPEFVSPVSTRLRKHLPFYVSACTALVYLAACAPADLTVSNAILVWFAFHCFFRTFPNILALDVREYAATDFAGHIYGALFAAMCGTCHLILQSQALPALQSWLALLVLLVATLP